MHCNFPPFSIIQIGDGDNDVHEINLVIENPQVENPQHCNTEMPDCTVITEPAVMLISSSDLNSYDCQGDTVEEALVESENSPDS